MIILLGLLAFVVYFVVFYFAIKLFKFPIPGSGEISEAIDKIKLSISYSTKDENKEESKYRQMAQMILIAIGGPKNIKTYEHCVTRLRLTLENPDIVDENKVMSAGASGIIRPSKKACQIVIGTDVQFVYDEFEQLLEVFEETQEAITEEAKEDK